MIKDNKYLIGRLKAYANKECSAKEAEEIRAYLVSNPQRIIEVIYYMRKNAMTELDIDQQNDPFKSVVAEALEQAEGKIANIRLHNGIRSLLSEKSGKNYSAFVPKPESLRNVSERKLKHPQDMNTVDFTTQEFKAINEVAANMMENINPEKSTLGNMIAQLLTAVPSMSVEEATDVCRNLVKGVTNFNEVLEVLKTNDASEEAMVQNIYDRCIDAMADKTAEEQAAILINFLTFVQYVNAANLGMTLEGENANTFEQILTENKSVEGEITPEILDQLKAQLKDSIANSTIILTKEEELRQLISAAGESESLTEELAKRHLSDMDFKSYAALVAYIACLKGEVEGADENVQPEILGASVAAGIEREKTMQDAKSGRISWEKAVKYLKWIGGALLYGLFAWVTFKLTMLMFSATAIITTLFLDASFIGLAAGLILGGFVAYKGASWFVYNVVSPIVKGAGEIYDRIVNTLRSGVIIDKVKTAYHNFISFIKKSWHHITNAPIIGVTPVVVS
ncbi:MAG: hypothetical protein K2K26_12240 [Muribaculaceae bacterium]|nr:hypothetical protein [Muribaculaceae bacterium]